MYTYIYMEGSQRQAFKYTLITYNLRVYNPPNLTMEHTEAMAHLVRWFTKDGDFPVRKRFTFTRPGNIEKT